MKQTGQRDVVLFLGAGFSRPAGLPLMREFWPESLHDLTKLREYARLDRGPLAAPMLAEAGGRFERFRDHCATLACVRAQADNVETVYSIAEAMQCVGVEEIALAGSTVSIDELHRSIRLWVWKTYQQAPWARLDRDGPIERQGGSRDATRRFLEQVLRTADLPDRTTIVTTNYDLVVEHLAWGLGHTCRYPLSAASARLFDCCGGGDPYVSLAGGTDGVLPVCKLHGSVNFFKLKKDEETIGVAADLGDGRTRIGRSTSRPQRDRPTLFWVDAIWELMQRYPQASPELVPPTFSKNLRKPWFAETWKAAFDALVTARSVIFVGYSLPESDAYVRAVLQAAMAQRVGEPPRAFVVDRSPDTLERFQALWPWCTTFQTTTEDIVGEALDGILRKATDR